MPGLYDNETQKYLLADWLEQGMWFEDENSNLYIVPTPSSNAEIEGPDGPIIEVLNLICRENGGIVAVEDGERLGLFYVPDFLKRFDPHTGLYHA